MPGFALQGLIGLVLLTSGWFAGSLYPAPENWLSFVRGRATPVLARIDLSAGGLERLRATLTAREFAQLSRNAALLAASSGDAIVVDRSAPGAVLEEHSGAAQSMRGFAVQPANDGGVFENSLHLCPGMTVSNAPPADDNDNVRNFASLVLVNGVVVAANPARGACLSSGVGTRNGRRHKGLDLHARNGGPIYAAAAGTVIEKLYRDDYGNMLLIDHGSGVYTRYAHLSSFASDIAVGARVEVGQQVGLMGNTAAYPIPVHLHYELLVGDYNTPAASFGLTPHSPFEFPAAGGADVAARTEPELIPAQLTRSNRQRASLCADGPLADAALATIRRGDRLETIANACYGDPEAWRQIVACNPFLLERNRGGVSPLNGGDLLYVGDRLSLPAPGQACPT